MIQEGTLLQTNLPEELEHASQAPSGLPRPDAAIALVFLLAIHMGRNVIATILYFVLPESLGQNAQYVAMLIQQLLIFALPIALYYRARPTHLLSVRRRRLSAHAMVGIVVAATLGVFVLNLLNAWWLVLLDHLHIPITESALPVPDNLLTLVLSIVVIAAAPALFEEVLCRGFLFSALETRGTWRAAVLSGLLFSLLHVQYAALPAHLVLGLVLGLVMVGFDSIWAAMLYHFIHNAITMLAAYYTARYATITGTEEILQSGIVPSVAEMQTTLVPMLCMAAVAVAMLLWPMRALKGKTELPRIRPAEQPRLSRPASVLLGLILTLLISIYLFSMMTAMRTGAGAL